MKGSWKRLVSVVLGVSLLMSSAVQTSVLAQSPEAEGQTTDALALDYTIYPLVREKNYTDGGFDLGENIHIVYADGIDEATRNLTRQTLEGIQPAPQITQGTEMEDGKVNVLVGIKGDGSAADQELADVSPNMTIESAGKTHENVDIFQHEDAHDSYILRAQDGTIAIVGKTTDAAFYGVTTLNMILDEMAEQGVSTIRNLTIRDYASVAQRGFIEGYYGVPWGVDNRCMLMEWGGRWKMNAYFYAPKNDLKHNSQWRAQYTAEELEEFRRMAQVGNDTKCRFIYSLHTFMSEPFRFDENYETDLQIVLDKFESLYQVGVRQFAILADDAAGTSAENIARLCNDVAAWGESKGDVYPMLHCPTTYNAAWTNEDGYKGLGYLDENLSEGIQVMWTGKETCGHADQEGAELYTKNVAKYYYGDESKADEVRRPVMWLNWPVNDVSGSTRLLLGPGSNEGGSALGGSGSVAVLNRGDADYYAGIISNPMQQASANKIPLFAVADFTWNDDDYNGMQSWKDSFQFVDPDASEELYEIAKHASDPSPNVQNMVCGESEELREILEGFLAEYQAGTFDAEAAQQICQEFRAIDQACVDFMEKSKDEGLKADIGPFAKSLRYLVQAGEQMLEAACALEEGRGSDAWSLYSNATVLLNQSEHVNEVPGVGGEMKAALAGTKRLRPFVNGVLKELEPKVGAWIDPDYQSFYMDGAMNTYYDGTKGKATDGDPSTAAHVYDKDNTNPSATPYQPGDVIFGISYANPTTIEYFRFLSVDSGDRFGPGRLEYRVEGEDTFREVGPFDNSCEWDFSQEPLENVVDIRVVNTAEVRTWVKVCEMGTYTPDEPSSGPVPCNYFVEGLANGNDMEGNVSFDALLDDDPNNYVHYEHFPRVGSGSGSWPRMVAGDAVGAQFENPIQLGRIVIRQGANDSHGDRMSDAVLEYSMDGETYTPILTNINSNVIDVDVSYLNVVATHVRLRNGQDSVQWLAIREFSVTEGGAYADTNVPELKEHRVAVGGEYATLGPVGELTLQPGEFIGICLPRIRDVVNITCDMEGGDALTLEAGANLLEMKSYTQSEDGIPARYIRVSNHSDQAVTCTLNRLEVYSDEVYPPSISSSTIGGEYQGTSVQDAFDGDLGTELILDDYQNEGGVLVLDLGQTMTIDSLQLINNDSASDYLRYAQIDTATTLENQGDWQELMKIGGPSSGDDTQIVQAEGWTHTISYCYAGSKPGDAPLNRQARYLRITILTQVGRWSRVREIAINSMISGNDYEKAYFPTSNDPTLEGTVEATGYPATNMVDGNVRTTYRPKDDAAGTMLYRLSEDVERIHTLSVLQSPNTRSNAIVSVRPANQQQFIEIGALTSSLNEFSLDALDSVAEIRISWEEGTVPEIYEIFTSTKGTEAVGQKEELKKLIDQAEAMDTTGRDPVLVSALENAMESAKLVYHSAYVTQMMVDDAVRELNGAICAFPEIQYTVTFDSCGGSEVNAVTVTAGEVVSKPADPTREGYTFQGWYLDEACTQAYDFSMPVETSITLYAKWAEQVEANKTLLQKTYDYAVTLDTTGVVESAVDVFEKALAEAKAVLDNPNATQEQVNTAWDNLLEGIWALGLKQGDKTMLELLIARADDMVANADKYVEANWQQLVDALEAAKAVMEDGNALQNDVDQAAEALLNAILAQRFKADKSILEDLIGKAEGMDLSGYTAESVATFRVALANAQAVMADNSLTEDDQAKVNDAVAALTAAMDGLTAGGAPETTDKPEASQNPEATDKPQTTDKPQATEKPENVPQTGDSAQLMVYVAALAAAALLMGTTVVVRRRRS